MLFSLKGILMGKVYKKAVAPLLKMWNIGNIPEDRWGREGKTERDEVRERHKP